MKIFKHSMGTVIAFGYDLHERRPSPHRISWVRPDGALHLDWNDLPDIVIAPEFVVEAASGAIVAYQPGLAIEMTPTGDADWWSFKVLKPH